MRLLMISGDRAVPAGKRGPFWYTLQEFHRHWDRIDILMPGMHGVPHADRLPLDLPGNVYLHPSPWGLSRQSQWIHRKGNELAALHRHNVMTVHDYPPFYNSRGALEIHKKSGLPFALEIHHIVGWPKAADLKERIGRFLSRFVIPKRSKAASAIRVVNDTVRDQLSSWGVPLEKISVVPSFYLDREAFAHDIAPPKSYDMVVCARLVANKGLENVIDTLSILPDARLLIIGDGPLKKTLEKKVESMGVANRVTFLGWLPTLETVLGAVLTSRVFVMASLSEGGPRSALEAMALGMPIVTTRVGVMPEVVQDGVNGFFTDGSPKDIAAKVGRLLMSEELRIKIGTEAKHIIEIFDREKLVREYADFLKSIAHRK